MNVQTIVVFSFILSQNKTFAFNDGVVFLSVTFSSQSQKIIERVLSKFGEPINVLWSHSKEEICIYNTILNRVD